MTTKITTCLSSKEIRDFAKNEFDCDILFGDREFPAKYTISEMPNWLEFKINKWIKEDKEIPEFSTYYLLTYMAAHEYCGIKEGEYLVSEE